MCLLKAVTLLFSVDTPNQRSFNLEFSDDNGLWKYISISSYPSIAPLSVLWPSGSVAFKGKYFYGKSNLAADQFGSLENNSFSKNLFRLKFHMYDYEAAGEVRFLLQQQKRENLASNDNALGFYSMCNSL